MLMACEIVSKIFAYLDLLVVFTLPEIIIIENDHFIFQQKLVAIVVLFVAFTMLICGLWVFKVG